MVQAGVRGSVCIRSRPLADCTGTVPPTGTLGALWCS